MTTALPRLTTQEAADIAHVLRGTINAAIRRKRLHAVKHGRDWAIEPAALEKWMNDHAPQGGRPSKAVRAQRAVDAILRGE